MGHLSNDEFFTKLVELFDSRKGKDHGHIFLTQKRLSYDQPPLPEPTSDTILPDLHPPRPLPVLIRATNGKGKENRAKKIKLSTVAGMTTLKPRDRSKRKTKGKKKKATIGGIGA
ncbi:signal recognition particle subunit SRP14 [Apiospora sp. TS-2023a]